MIISLAGTSGSGKSTIKKLLGQKLGLKTYSMGDLREKLAIKKGLSLDELNALAAKDLSIDQEIDDYQKELGKIEDDFIIDSWLSWYFIPQSFKILLTVNENTGAERIFAARKQNQRLDEPLYKNIAETKEILRKRLIANQERFKKHYNITLFDKNNYDLVIDTNNITPEEICLLILTHLKTKTKTTNPPRLTQPNN